MEDLIKIFDDLQSGLDIAKRYLMKGDTHNTLYNLDRADSDISFLRVKILELKYGEQDV
jgi:hypothetical protein